MFPISSPPTAPTRSTGAASPINLPAWPPRSGPVSSRPGRMPWAAPCAVCVADRQRPPDALLCRPDGNHFGCRGDTLASAVGEPGWLRVRYQQQVGGGVNTLVTTIVTCGELHLRAHRVTLDRS